MLAGKKSVVAYLAISLSPIGRSLCGMWLPQRFVEHVAIPDTGTRLRSREDVKAYTSAVAHDVTQPGPAAWRRHFADSPSFFMASVGHLVFPNSASATKGIQDFARTIDHMELHWGEDLRVDPLTPDLAVIATPWHEIRVDTSGNRVDETGFFAAIAEYRNGHWQFWNAHWSVAGPPPAVRQLHEPARLNSWMRRISQEASHFGPQSRSITFQ